MEQVLVKIALMQLGPEVPLAFQWWSLIAHERMIARKDKGTDSWLAV